MLGLLVGEGVSSGAVVARAAACAQNGVRSALASSFQ